MQRNDSHTVPTVRTAPRWGDAPAAVRRSAKLTARRGARHESRAALGVLVADAIAELHETLEVTA
jgi:hypothetical protein